MDVGTTVGVGLGMVVGVAEGWGVGISVARMEKWLEQEWAG